MNEPVRIERLGEAGGDVSPEKPDLPEPLGMAFVMLICFGLGCGAAYVVMKTDWSLLAKLYAGINGVFFTVTGLAAFANALRDIASRFTAKSRSGI